LQTQCVYAIAALTGDTEPVVREPERLGVVVNEEYLSFTPEVGDAWSSAISRLSTIDARLPDWAETFHTAADLQGPEAAANHVGRDTSRYQPDVQDRLREAAAVPLARYDAARTKAIEITASMTALLNEFDAFITPTVLTTAPPVDGFDALAVRAQLLTNTRLANLTRHPAITIPVPTPGPPSAYK
jgi:Asp-tRNA(Asn)/Glu-tRNA(Gln) amidotransferase A subunit family amidase